MGIEHRPCGEALSKSYLNSRLDCRGLGEIKEEPTSWTEAAGHTVITAHMVVLGVSARFQARGAALAVLHVVGAFFCCSTPNTVHVSGAAIVQQKQ